MSAAKVMTTTLVALVPGGLVATWLFGIGIALNVLVAILIALAIESIMLRITGKPISNLLDGTAVLTGALLGLCLPPLLPFWMIGVAILFALVFGKHMYGGTGQNVFNPAMIGYAVLIVSFPLAMSLWPEPETSDDLINILAAKSTFSADRTAYDGVSAATSLDAYKFRAGQTDEEFFTESQSRNWQSWAWINFAFLLGGGYLLYRKIISWHAPVALLGTIGLLALLFYDAGSSQSLGSPLFHLFSGATMLAAFFIVTDPVTCPSYTRGIILFAITIGLLTFIIRSTGAYPEGIAFSVLLANALSPLIDHWQAKKT